MRPAGIRRVETESSIWLFDVNQKLFNRLPRTEAPPQCEPILYTGSWEPYEDLIPTADAEGFPRLTVVRPVPWGTGQLRMTGRIIDDSEHS